MRTPFLIFSLLLFAFPGAHATLAGAATPRAPFHLRLLKSEPAKDAILSAAPTAIKLWFTEGATVAVSSITLTDAAGSTIALGRVRSDRPDATAVVADVKGTLKPGAYVVKWRTASRDGHLVRGEFAFSIAKS
jgi:methionine-rich copper-binding protein CopC